jgi:hypothetical protein
MSTPGRAQELLEALARDARANLLSGRVAPAGVETRTYRGRSVEDIIPQIQSELGAEAIIVRRRDGLTGGVLGFFQHPFVEIEAMEGAPSIDVYDDPEPVAPPSYEPPRADPTPPVPLPLPPAPAMSPPAPPSQARPTLPPTPTPTPMPQVRALPPALQARAAPQARPTPSPFPPREQPSPPVAGSAYVTAHLAALARAGRAGAGTAPDGGRAAPPRPRREPAAPPVNFHEITVREDREPVADVSGPASFEYPPPPRREAPIEYQPLPRREAPVEYQPPPREAPERRTVAPGSHTRARAGIERRLSHFGISEELARELIDGAGAHALPLAPRSGLVAAVRATLAQRMPVAPPLPIRGAAIVLVGAGGAGKTTCCAALLGAYRANSTLPASFATITRSERGGLRLILSPRIVKPTPAGSARALSAVRRAKADGMAVLDTPRLSPADKAGVRELALLLGELKPERIVIALPATLGAAAAAQLLSALRPLGANALAVTHADETDQIGVAVEAACRFGLAPEYMLDRGRSGGWRLSRVDPTELAAKLLQ